MAGAARDELGMREQRAVEAEQRRQAADLELVERAQHPHPGVLAVDAVDDQLRDHRVVEAADLGAGDDAGVDADAGAGRLAVGGDPPGRGQEAAGHVLGVDPALDRVAAQDDVLLSDRERLAGRDQHLLADEVDAGHLLGDRVLDLDPRVHLHEVVGAVRGQQPLDRPGGAVAGRAGGVDRDLPDPLAQLRVDRRRRRLLDQLLVAALDRAVALAEVDHVPVRVREHLHLDVARILEVALDVDAAVGEVLLALALRRLERALGLVGRRDELHPLAAAAGRRLHDQRVADLVAEPQHLRDRLDRLGRARDDRHAGGLHRRARLRLRAHQLDRRAGRPDPDQARRPRRRARRRRSRRGSRSRDGSPRRPPAAPRRGSARRRGSSPRPGRARSDTPRRRRADAPRRGRPPSRRRPSRCRARAASGRSGPRSRRGSRRALSREAAWRRVFSRKP